MQDSRFKILIVLAVFAPGLVSGQLGDLRLPISLDADSSEYDGKSTMVVFRGLRLTQGSMGIEADDGRANKLDFEDSVWQLSGNVIIDVENGHIECDSADLTFSNYALVLATITGSPATFEMQRPNNSEPTYAEAGRLEYDLAQGIIEFSGQAKITENGNQISSSYLVYNIKEQLINAQSGGDGDPKVRIIYTPKEAVEPDAPEGSNETNAGSPEGTEEGGR
jgi:lipopolysaccharide transport protein LptA